VRIGAVEKKLEALEGGRIDRNHAQIMETLHRMESRMLIHIEERVAGLESKMRNVA
jgi:DNA-binding PadR family transcriptional regulator